MAVIERLVEETQSMLAPIFMVEKKRGYTFDAHRTVYLNIFL